LSVYPAGVKQARIEKLSADDGKTTLINNPCVVKSLSFAPYDDDNEQLISVSLVLYVYDGNSVIMYFPFVGPQYLSTNLPILMPADGLRVNSSLSFQTVRLIGSIPESSLHFANIRVAYQQ